MILVSSGTLRQMDLPCLLFSPLNVSFIFEVQAKEIILEAKCICWIVVFRIAQRDFFNPL